MDIPEGVTLFWHRRDLRTVDNRGLSRAAERGAVLPVYILDPRLLSIAGARRTAFFLDSLRELQETYRELGTDLLVRWGDPTVEIPGIAAEFQADAAIWNQDHSRYGRERDLSILQELEDEGLTVREAQDMTLHEPGSILTGAGEHYSVFSYYHKKWVDREWEDPATQPDGESLVSFDAQTVSLVLEEGSGTLGTSLVEPDEEPLQLDPGRNAALDRLQTFIDGPIYEYSDARDTPAAEGTSRLSQDLKFGLLGIREVFEATDGALREATEAAAQESVEAFRRQLAWRDFYVQVLAANPETVWENFKDFQHPIEWQNDGPGLEAWKQGETGFPIVDAGMRQLRETGYMHNRVRMIVASFLTKDLQIDWREGYRWFREQLVDHETANDVGGWQWAASTGTDAQPYFRIFNPMTQGERYDPEAEYIRKYVPELSGAAPRDIHRWDQLTDEEREAAVPGYIAPIVDHASRRESAIEMFEAARGSD